MVTTVRHVATPARWSAALDRARHEGIQVRQLAGSGAWIATSGKDASVAYEVTPHTCECHAGQSGDPVCKHRALLRHQLGLLRERPSLVAGLSEADVLALKADAMRRHVLHGDPLVNVHTGELIAPAA